MEMNCTTLSPSHRHVDLRDAADAHTYWQSVQRHGLRCRTNFCDQSTTHDITIYISLLALASLFFVTFMAQESLPSPGNLNGRHRRFLGIFLSWLPFTPFIVILLLHCLYVEYYIGACVVLPHRFRCLGTRFPPLFIGPLASSASVPTRTQTLNRYSLGETCFPHIPSYGLEIATEPSHWLSQYRDNILSRIFRSIFQDPFGEKQTPFLALMV
ncbi:hypothetical protein IW262DRAFT_267418 [Armillaria fumosa]|nr:hypothetical protein IW262DRAFT_267418 [Armillaria fumosa]